MKMFSGFGRYGWRLRSALMNGSNSLDCQISLMPEIWCASSALYM